MTMSELYDEMKAALKFFGLSFHEMDKVSVASGPDGYVQFTHEGRVCGRYLPDA